jgi:phage terminase large subunit-like protein
MTKPKPFIPCTRYIDQMVRLPDGSRPVLAEHQRAILDHGLTPVDGLLLYLTILWSEIKKSGKTAVAAWVASWVLNTWGPRAEVLCAGNDFEQSVARIFSEIVRVQLAHPTLKRRIVKSTERVLLLEDTSRAAPVALDDTGEAGAEPSLVVHDEAWGIVTERARRLYDELTPPPTRRMALRWISSYAGYPGESVTLETLYKRGLSGEPIPGLPDCTASGPLFMFWSHTPRMPWQTPAYYEAQKSELRPSAFLRLHRNEWVAAESAFITPEMWDPCVDPSMRPLLPTHDAPLFAGVDASTKGDTAAVVTVYWLGDRLALGPYRIWRPSATAPLDLEVTLEAYLRELDTRYTLAAVLCDPWQLHRSITTLKAAGIPIDEFPQTVPNTTRMGQAVFELLHGRNLALYPSADLREQALNTVAVESSRGWRIAKEKASRKIDAVVAMSMACVAALDGKESIVELKFLTPAPRSANEIQAEADQEFQERYEAAQDAVTTAIQQQGCYWP